MTSAQTILVATDLSAPARHAVERAFHLAASTGSELYILHAMELDAVDSLRGPVPSELRRGAWAVPDPTANPPRSR